jgi:hypothetical protein
MIVDGDLWNCRAIASFSSGTFVATVSALSSYVGIGAHQLVFCVVQSGDGRISAGQTINLNVISSPAAISVRGSATASYGLNAYGQDSSGGLRQITIGNWGFTTQITGSTSGVTLTKHWAQITDSAVLLVVKLVNANSASSSVTVTCDCDLYVDDRDAGLPCCELEGQGFLMQGATYAFSFVGKSCPLFRDVSFYWFGLYYTRSDFLLSQIGSSISSLQDQACAWSWSDLSVPGGGFLTVGVLFKSGPIVTDSPSVVIFSAPSCVMSNDTIEWSGAISDSRSSVISGLLVVDGDLSQIRTLWSSLPPDSFHYSVSLPSLDLSHGDHQFSFYAASAGRVSAAASQTIKIIGSSVVIPVRSGSERILSMCGASLVLQLFR